MTGRGFTRLLCIACAAAFPFMLDALALNSHRAFAQAAPASQAAGPRFRADGPDADAFGRTEGYPSCKGLAYVDDTRCRVGALSRYDTLFPARTITAPKQSVPLARAVSEPVIRYGFAGLELTLDDYLNRQPVTGLLIAKDDTILVERYQYGRTDTDRLTSFSMAKTVVGLLIGIALKEKMIGSVDDLAETYVPGLKDTEYGRTPIKALLLMASGVAFSEDYDSKYSDIYQLARLTIEPGSPGSLAALKQFNTRRDPPGVRFSYSSAESLVLGLVLTAATKRTVSDYAAEKIWQPLGAEADATWIIDATGQEITFGYVNAVLRDWARLGLMLANHGNWQGKNIVPEGWLAASAADALPTDSPLAKYGYQIWYSGDTRRFALRGLRGQFVFVDPDLKLVLVQTALRGGPPETAELFALWTALRAQVQ
ncbi:serine hydrolase [Bradyrhizobium arachidis]|uniref:serine hydrolase domain-containing protein n=1 Tax=Bradyrhizobium arachidis TaxID=858423 RepID=UPI002162BCEE|nr:serine hydrolase [Bradyrhizobium arachidis]UVO31640.1 beta-lactamase family protein [Bradyrhizobium arachidis]